MYKRLHILAFTTFICIGACHLQARGAPVISCEEPSIDFGIVDNNTQSLVHSFAVWNRGDSELQIQGVSSSCGCTTANVGDRKVAPGASTSIKATFTLQGRKGKQKKEIRVTSNDPLNPQLVLQIACDIRLAVDTDVSGFLFNERVVSDSQTVSRTIHLQAASNVTFQITSVDTSAAPSVTLETSTVETGRVYALKATVRTESIPAGMTQERITVCTDHPSFGRIEIPVSLYKAEEVMIVPTELPLLETVLKQPNVRRDLYLRIQGTNVWEFFDVEPVGNFTVAVEDRSPGHCRVVLSGLGGVDDAGTLRLAVTVKSPRTGQERRIEVRLRRYVPKKSGPSPVTQPTNGLTTGTFREVKKSTAALPQ